MRFFTFFVFLHFLFASVFASGSVNSYAREINRVILENKLRKKDPGAVLNFFILLNPVSDSLRVKDQPLPGYPDFLSTVAFADSVNEALNSIYRQYGIECYFIFINAFELKIQSRPPPGWTLDDLFGSNTFFQENSAITQLKQEHATIAQKAIAGSILSRMANAYAVCQGRYVTHFPGNKTASYYLNFTYRKKLSPNSLPNGFDRIYTEMRNYFAEAYSNFRPTLRDEQARVMLRCLDRACRNTEASAAILNTFRVDSLKILFSNFRTARDFGILTTHERWHSLSLLCGGTMSSGTASEPGEEELALHIINECRTEDVPVFLDGLTRPSVLNNEPRYQGNKNDGRSLVQRLVSGLDDHFSGPNNYGALVKILSGKLRSRTDFPQLEEGIYADLNAFRRIITWHPDYLYSVPPPGSVLYDVSFEGDAGSLKVSPRLKKGYVWTPLFGFLSEYEPVENYVLGPFDPVIFVNECSLPLVEDAGAPKGCPVVVPAIFLKYADDKEFNKQALAVAGVAGEAVTLVSGSLTLVKAVGWARKLWAAVEMSAALGNITLQVQEDALGEEMRKVLEWSNYFIAGVGVKNIMQSGSAGLGSVYQSIKNSVAGVRREDMLGWARDMLAPLPSGKTRLERLKEVYVQTQNRAAEVSLKLWERLKKVYKSETGKDLDLDFQLSQWDEVLFGPKISNLEEFFERIPAEFRPGVRAAFVEGEITFTMLEKDFTLYRHCSPNSANISNWWSPEILSKTDARKYLALPNNNSAEEVVEVLVKKGTPVLVGKVSSQVNNVDFGPYATGGGNQYFILLPHSQNSNIVGFKSRIPNPKG